MAQKKTGAEIAFEWDPQRIRAAELVAEDELTDEEIATECEVSRSTLARWKNHPAFQTRVKAVLAMLEEASRRYAIGRKQRRLKGYDDRYKRMLQIIEERSVDPVMQLVPGGKTGLMLRSVKCIGAGVSSQIVEEYTLDAALLKELRELEKQAAIEAGQWTEKQEVGVKASIQWDSLYGRSQITDPVEEALRGGD